jgi:emfourin
METEPHEAGGRARGIVSVRRSGGFAGLVTENAIDLATDPAGAEVAALVRRIDLGRVPKSAPQPDRFIYTVRIGDRERQIHEQDLTPELRRLVDLVLTDDR